MIGRKLAHYTIRDRLGSGGMGEVYLAHDEHLEREVAIKVLPEEFASDAKKVARFHRESKLASQLSHANIATIYDSGEQDGCHYIAMELVKGKTLAALIRPRGMSLEEILALAIPLVEGLAEAHARGVLHRDLKPGNVMVDERGRVKILDFGLSRPLPGAELTSEGLTSSGKILGTPHYMSPEQVHGKEMDARSDLFSVGVILYELATGVRPFEADSLPGVLTAVTLRQPTPVLQVNPHLGELFAHVVDRLLEKDPQHRFQHATDLAEELRSLRTPTSIVPVRKRRVRPAATVALVGLTLLAIGGFYRPGWFLAHRVADATPTVPVSTKLKLALIPISFPEGNDAAKVMARMLTDGLSQMLNTPAVDLISPSYLRGKARYAGIAGELDAYRATTMAEEEGAAVLVFGTIEPGLDGLDLRCELLERGTTRTHKLIPTITLSKVPGYVDDLGASILVALGFDPPVEGEDFSALTDDPRAYELWAEAMTAYEQTDWTEAARLLRPALQLDPDFALARYHLASALWWDLHSAEALQVLEPMLSKVDQLSDLDRRKLELLHQLLLCTPDGSGGAAVTTPGLVATARKFAEANPRDKDALALWMEYAYHHVSEQDYQQVVDASRALLKLDPDYGPVAGHYMDAALAISEEDAREAAESLVRLGTKLPWAPYGLLLLGKQDEALRLAKEHRSNDIHGAALTAIALGEYDLALEMVGPLPSTNPEARCAARIGLGLFEEARLAQRGTPANIGNLNAYELRLPVSSSLEGRIFKAGHLIHIGWLDEAEQAVRDLAKLTISPDFEPMILWLSAWISWERGFREKALEQFEEAARKRPSVYWPFLAQQVGHAFTEEGHYGQAQSWLEQLEPPRVFFAGANRLLQSVACRTQALFDLAVCREAQGDTDGAIGYLERFLQHWHEPYFAFPEIEQGLQMYADLTGQPYRPKSR